MHASYQLLDKGLVPDFIVRRVIRALLRQRLREIDRGSFEANHAAKMRWIEELRARDAIAEVPEKANEQHYQVPTKFIISTLGPYAKYSSCLYPTGKETLAEAESLMLESYCEKAQLRDNQEILDLGCGWGSLSLFLAQKYPNARITGLSNSATQKAHIDAVAKLRGLTNIVIITADINTFNFGSGEYFDRIISIEMFEHMKNYQVLFQKVSTWLRPNLSPAARADDALLFIQVFCHRSMPYHFEEGDGWMAQNFFSGGTMPSHDLFTYFQSDLTLIRSWYINGMHYSRTLEDWLKLQDKNGKDIDGKLRAGLRTTNCAETRSAPLLVCKSWLRVATPLFYSVVVLRCRRQTEALSRTLFGNKMLGTFIQKLRLEGGFGQSVHTIVEAAPNITDLWLTLDISCFDNVTGLCHNNHIENDQIRTLFEALCNGIRTWKALVLIDLPFAGFRGCYPSKRALEICGVLATAPHLQTLVLKHPQGSRDFLQQITQNPSLEIVHVAFQSLGDPKWDAMFIEESRRFEIYELREGEKLKELLHYEYPDAKEL
ncbi:hypothetical protein D9615_007920 [Tricholomella constricta]|uniref:Uncharacterized protein n=1 Tax=Tricholomella constricta TaxID=117010 RepID=A0A8H5H2A6_9AGAR|nr:hypothetical protein D9615_007920 [Tricholomella constricta]